MRRVGERMRPLTMLQAAHRADTQSGLHLSFARCKGGLLSTDPAYALRVSGKTDGDLCVKAGSKVLCAGKNLWPHEDVRVERYRDNFTLQVPAGRYTFSARVRSTDTHADTCLVYINNSDAFIAIPISRGEGNTRTKISFDLSDAPAIFSLYASNNHANSEGDLAFFEDIMLEEGSTATDYAPYTGTEITVPCDLHEGDIWYPSLGFIRHAQGYGEVTPTETLAAAAGKTLIWQNPTELFAELTATMPVRR